MRSSLGSILMALFSAPVCASIAEAQAPPRVAGPSIATAQFSAARPEASRFLSGIVPGSTTEATSRPSPFIIGAVAGVLGGLAVARWSGEGDRSTGDRVEGFFVGGLLIAVPVTVVAAMLIGGDDG